MKKKIIGLIILAVIGAKVVHIIQENYIKNVIIETEAKEIEDTFYNKYEMMTLEAIKEHLQHGNLLYSKDNVVTEVQILYMEYLLKNDYETLFKQTLEEVLTRFKTEEELISVGGHISEQNHIDNIPKASLKDNLRIYKLTMKAYKLWHNEYYKKIGLEVAERIYKYNTKEDRLYSYHDGIEEIENQEIALADLDLKAIALLYEEDESWQSIFQKSKDIVEKAYISNDFPLYYTYYNYEQKKYNTLDKLNMQESLYIVESLSESGIYKEETIKWLKDQIKAGGVYEQYHVKTGRVSSHKENMIIYSTISQIGKNIGDIELYTLGIEKMLNFQIKDKTHEYFGVFMDKDKEDIDEYEMVQALLAF